MSRNNFGNGKKASAFSVAEVIVTVILIVVIAGLVFCNVVFRSDNKSTSIFGYSFYKTRAVNMVPEIPVNTVIIAKKSEIPNIKEKSVILCNIGEYTALTRVVEIQQEEGQTYYIVKFDTAPANETFRVSGEDVIAKAVWQLESFGKFLDFATSVPGIIIAVIIPLAVIIIFQAVRIKNIKELEREASSLDDIDEVIFSRKKESPPAVTFTEPKFSEDVTDKLPAVRPVSERRRSDAFDFDSEDAKPKAKLTVDDKGRADYKAAERPVVRENPAETPLERFERVNNMPRQTSAVGASARASSGSEPVYANRPTRIEPRSGADYSAKVNETVSSGKEERVVFTPHLSNIIPDSLANIQEEAVVSGSVGREGGFSESVKSYFEKERAKPAAEVPIATEENPPAPTIPEKAVVPKENIAPVKKKKSSKTLEELMNIIDAEETKLKK